MNKALFILAILMAGVFAFGSFDAQINNIEAGRGFIKGDMAYMSNCNEPGKTQNTVFSVEIDYPDDCSGPMDISYKYYNPYKQEYIDGADSCVISSDKVCEFTTQLWYGGALPGTDKYSPFMIVEGECRETGKNYQVTIPLTVQHEPIKAELDFKNRIDDIEETLNNIKGIISDCGDCCSALSAEYVKLDKTKDDLKDQLARCDYTDYIIKTKELRDSVDSLLDNTKKKASACENPAQAVADAVGNTAGDVTDTVGDITGTAADTADEVGNVADSVTDTANDVADTASKGCLSIVILLGFVGYLYKH